MISREELISFEQDIANLFEQGKIKAPVHLSGGNEDALISIFGNIKPDDWVFSNHRSHYHALLKGVPASLVKYGILNGHSITLNFSGYHFFSSAIVGGIIPIATGVAMTGQTVWCFIGDMAATTGIFSECYRYSMNHNLPIHFIVEDNGMSVQTPTKEAWGKPELYFYDRYLNEKMGKYDYKNKWPHAGCGKWVSF